MMQFLKNVRAWQWILILLLIGLSAGTWYYLYTEHLTLVYNDAKSYMNISRLVVDNQQPGLAQIGSVWLPLAHLIKLPFIWIDWAWHSGFAGSVVSMASYILTVIGIAAITLRLTGKRAAAVIAGIVAALNVNFLYLQSTPLTEPLYLGIFTWSVFCLVAYWQSSNIKFLLPLAGLTALQCLTRYDGWFVAVVFAALILGYELWVRKAAFKKALGHLLLFVVPVAFACLLWFAWNALIFGDPLYFIAGPGSARAQQQIISEASGLITKGSIGHSLTGYGFAVVGNLGWWVIGAGVAGWLVYFVSAKRKELPILLAALCAVLAIFVFNVLALWFGFSSINVPELHWASPSTLEPLFNVRYGILLLPLAAIGAGLLAAKWRWLTVPILAVVVFQGTVMLQQQPITLRDGTRGASAFVQQDLAAAMRQYVKPGSGDALLSLSVVNPLAFESGMELKQIIHEGVRDRWQASLDYPEGNAEWIVMGPNASDPVRRALYDGPALRTHYTLVYQDKHGSIYQRNQ